MGLFDRLKARAVASRQRIVLAEGYEPRTLTAADRIIADGIADVTLIGDPATIHDLADEMHLPNIANANIVDPSSEEVIDRYAPLLYELRKKKGMTPEQSRLTAANALYLGCLMIKAGDADGMVAGAMMDMAAHPGPKVRKTAVGKAMQRVGNTLDSALVTVTSMLH